MMTIAWPTATSMRIDGVSSRSRKPSALNRKFGFLTVAATMTSSSASRMPVSRARDERRGRGGQSALSAGRGLIGGHRDLFRGVGGGEHDGLGGRLGAVDVGGDAALAHDEHAVGHAEHLGQLGRDHEDRDALAGELGEQAVHLGLGAHVDAAGRLVDDEHASASVASHLASTTFCWLPPLRVPASVSSDAVFTSRRLAQTRAAAFSAAE